MPLDKGRNKVILGLCMLCTDMSVSDGSSGYIYNK
jgi:hypothetical protein